MLCSMEMLGCMLVFRRITAAHVAAFQAQTQVDPPISNFHAIFTDMLVGAGQLDVVEMSALSHNLPPEYQSQMPGKRGWLQSGPA